MLNSLNEIIYLSDRSIQIIARNIDNSCLAIALSNVPENIQNRVFSNLSKRRLIEIINIILIQDKVEDNQMYIDELKITINQLIDKGEIILEENEYETDIRKLEDEENKKKNVSNLNFNNHQDLSNFFLMLNTEARLKGFLALEPYLDDIEDKSLKNIIQLIVDGCSKKHISLYISNTEQNNLRAKKINMEIIKTGVSIILNGEMSKTAQKLLESVNCEIN